MSRRIDIAGQTFGKWTVLSRGARNGYWVCACACGNEKEVSKANLTSERSRQCEVCLAAQNKEHPLRLRHGHARKRQHSKLYVIWANMRQRCLDPNQTVFGYYGAKGIRICERWDVFENFAADVGEPPLGMSLDRFPNPFGNYEPSNVRWATRSEQLRNTRRTKLYEFRGRKMPLVELSETSGVNYNCLRRRLARGWSVERAIQP